MEYGLSAVRVRIDHNAVTVVRKPALFCDLRRGQQQMAEGRFLPGIRLIKRIEMLAGDDQYMRRGLRIKVIKGDTNIILMQYLGWYATVRYLTKYTIVHTHPTPIRPQQRVNVNYLA